MTAATSAATHGTYGGYQAHGKRGEEPCAECRAAARAYKRKHRKESSRTAELDRWRNSTYHEASRRLAKNHPAEFKIILRAIRDHSPPPHPNANG